MDIQLTKSPEELTSGFLSLSFPEDIASLLEIPYKVLNYHLYVTSPAEQYKAFQIAKKGGGIREIYAPTTTLKIIQKKLNFILQNVYKKIYERKICVHGFIYGKNVRTNALAHAKREYVFNIDILDFFPSINFGRVYGLFIGKPYSLSKSVAAVLARICAFKDLNYDLLPQGAPTSPIISNMICARMDDELYRLARRFNCRYTRYADDITFSTDRSRFPEELAIVNLIGKGQRLKAEIGNELAEIIEGNGFSINPNKVWIRNRYTRQEVTGLIVNEFPNVNRKYINQLRAMLHAWEKYGLRAAEDEFLDKFDKKKRWPFERGTLYKQVVKGKINFLKLVVGDESPAYLKLGQQLADLDPDFSGVFQEKIKQQKALAEIGVGAYMSSKEKKFDAFLCHASEDKRKFVRPLALALKSKGLKVWYDEFTLKVGDSLRRSIDKGLANSRYGIVVISRNFLRKEWPQRELDGLAALEVDGRKIILPVWHEIEANGVRKYSPTLADRVATSSKKGVDKVVADLMKAMG